MHEETEVLGALEWFDDDKRELFSDVRLRDFLRVRRVIKVWVRFGPAFPSLFAEVDRLSLKVSEMTSARDLAAQHALETVLPKSWRLLEVASEPLSDEEKADSAPPLDGFLYIVLPSGVAAFKPGQLAEPSPPGLGGRPGYAVRSADFYDATWGRWEPHEERRELMEYVMSLPIYHFKNGAEEFAQDLNAKGYTSLEGKPFDGASVRRVNLAAELLRGSSRPDE